MKIIPNVDPSYLIKSHPERLCTLGIFGVILPQKDRKFRTLSLSGCLCLSVCLFVSLSLSVSVCLSLFLSPSLFISVCECVSLCVLLSRILSVCLYFCLSLQTFPCSFFFGGGGGIFFFFFFFCLSFFLLRLDLLGRIDWASFLLKATQRLLSLICGEEA